MIGTRTRMVILILFLWAWTLGPVGYGHAGSLSESRDRAQLVADDLKRTEAEEIYRNNAVRDDVRRMRELCRIFEEDAAEANAKNRTEVEIYRDDTGPGVTEYHREYRESNRYARAADESRTIELCRQLEEFASPVQPEETEVRIYRNYTVPAPE